MRTEDNSDEILDKSDNRMRNSRDLHGKESAEQFDHGNESQQPKKRPIFVSIPNLAELSIPHRLINKLTRPLFVISAQ